MLIWSTLSSAVAGRPSPLISNGILSCVSLLYKNAVTTYFFASFGAKHGDILHAEIRHDDMTVFGYDMKFCRNFTEVAKGEPLIYINSLLNVGVAINQGSFSDRYGIGTGEGWRIAFTESRRG